MNFVDEQDRVRPVFQGLQNALQALLKITPVFGTCKQSTHVQGIDHSLCQNFWHARLRDAPSQAFCNGRFTDTGLAHQQRIVFTPTAQNLDGALNLIFAANERVNLALFGQLIQVLSELL